MSRTRIWVYATCLATFLMFFLCATPITHAQTVTDLYNFNQAAGDPASFGSPGTMVQGLDGNIYSTSPNGGTPTTVGEGTVFNMTPAGVPSELFTFDAPPGLATILLDARRRAG